MLGETGTRSIGRFASADIRRKNIGADRTAKEASPPIFRRFDPMSLWYLNRRLPTPLRCIRLANLARSVVQTHTKLAARVCNDQNQHRFVRQTRNRAHLRIAWADAPASEFAADPRGRRFQ